MTLFHGGCQGCTLQESLGLANCTKCQYFEGDWKLPNLNDSTKAKENSINKVREEAKRLANNLPNNEDALKALKLINEVKVDMNNLLNGLVDKHNDLTSVILNEPLTKTEETMLRAHKADLMYVMNILMTKL